MKFDFTKVIFTGDSLVDEATNKTINEHNSDGSVNTDTPYGQWESGSHWSYMLARVFNFDYTNTGVCGERIKNIYNSYLNSRILDYDPTFVFIDGGVNDVGGDGIAVDTVVEYMRKTIQSLLDEGVQVGLIWFPVDSSTFSSSAGNMIYLPAKYKTMADEFESDYPDQFIFFNFEGVTNFGTTSTGSSTIPQAYRRDGLHFNQAGYKATAEYMIQKIREADGTLAESQTKGASSVIIRG